MKKNTVFFVDKKQIHLIIFFIAISLLSGCSAKERKNQEKETKDKWKIKAEQSEGFSPSAKKKTVEFKKSSKPFKPIKKKALPQKRVSVKMSNAEISAVLRTLARSADINILISDKIVGKINISVKDTPWDQVFNNILKMQGLSYVHDENLIRIMTDEDLVNEIKREKLKQSLEKIEPLVTRVIKIDYADPVALRDNLKGLLGIEQGKAGDIKAADSIENSISVDPHTNSLIIRVVKSEMERILNIIEKLDRPTRQVLIKANIVETNKSTATELGAQWSSMGGKVTAAMDLAVEGGGFIGYATTSGKNNLSLQLSALQSKGKLNILSSPSITTVDNKKAVIESGKEIPFQTIEDNEVKIEYKKAVIRLEVTPHVIDDEVLKLVIVTSKDEIDLSVEVNGNPGIITKRAETEVVLFDGSTTVIGGLNKDKAERNKKGIPWLMDIPLLGYLFKWINNTNEMEELLIFITPEILKVRGLEEGVSAGEGEEVSSAYEKEETIR